MKASELTKHNDPIIAHIANKLCNENKNDWEYDSTGRYFLSPDSTQMYDVKTLQFHYWDDIKNNYKKHSEQEIKSAYEKISNLVSESLLKLKEAENLADEFGLEFSFNPTYGMGGNYLGKGTIKKEYNYVRGNYLETTREEGEWISSSSNC